MMQAFFLAMYSLVILTTFSTVCYAGGLYTSKDHVVIFNPVSYAKWKKSISTEAYMIQYYSASCGHCQRYAKLFKVFSASVWDWHNTVKIGVVNCDEYASLCAGKIPKGVPQLIYYKEGNPPHEAIIINGSGETFHANPGPLQKLLLEAMQYLPFLQPIMNQADAQKKPNGAVIIEDADGFIAKRVILGLRRADRKSTTEVTKPEIFWLKSGSKDKITIFQVVNHVLEKKFEKPVKEAQRWFVAKEVANILGLVAPTPPPIVRIEHPQIPDYYRPTIQFVDIYSSIRVFTWQDVFFGKKIEGSRFQALKNFTSVVTAFYKDMHERNTHPRVKEVAGHLFKFFEHLAGELAKGTRTSIKNDEWSRLYTTSEKNYQLPVVRKWSNCAGSLKSLRNYPCGLWLFFHSVLRMNKVCGEKCFKDPVFVLRTIRAFVVNFFDCKECRAHFKVATENMETKVQSREDGMIYLWKIHNGVNKRLSEYNMNGNDPYFPKVQFPTAEQCPRCRKETETTNKDEWNEKSWNMKEVTRYLENYYDLAKYPIGPRWPAYAEDEGSERYNTSEGFIHLSVYSYDFTVCGLMSVVCTAIAIVFFLLFYRRRLYCFFSRASRVHGKVLSAHVA